MKIGRSIIVWLTLLAFALSIAGRVAYMVHADREREAYFQKVESGEMMFSGPYCFHDSHPDILLIIVLLAGLGFFTALITKYYKKNQLWSALPIAAAISMYFYWYWETQRNLTVAESFRPEGLDLWLNNAGVFDVAAFSVLALTLILHAVHISRQVIGLVKDGPRLR